MRASTIHLLMNGELEKKPLTVYVCVCVCTQVCLSLWNSVECSQQGDDCAGNGCTEALCINASCCSYF